MKNVILLLSTLLVSTTAHAKDQVVPIHESNIRMSIAIDRAQRELDSFLAERGNPKSTARDFKVKVQFSSGGTVEHMWVTPVPGNQHRV
jgi:uncharacterized protein YegJ (DUF2314 family)